MKSLLLVSAFTLAVCAGCAPTAPAKSVDAAAIEASSDADVAAATEEKEGPSLASSRRPGDFVVHRFSGSYRDQPVKVSQRIVSRQGDTLLVALQIEGGDSFELEVDDSPSSRGELRAVMKVVGNTVEPIAVSDFETIMSELVLVADENDGLVDQTPVTMTVGETTMSAIQSTYQVRVGNKAGVMHTFAADGFGWGDLGGQILGPEGEVLYKAEIVELGHADVEVAAQSPAPGDEGLDIFEE